MLFIYDELSRSLWEDAVCKLERWNKKKMYDIKMFLCKTLNQVFKRLTSYYFVHSGINSRQTPNCLELLKYKAMKAYVSSLWNFDLSPMYFHQNKAEQRNNIYYIHLCIRISFDKHEYTIRSV